MTLPGLHPAELEVYRALGSNGTGGNGGSGGHVVTGNISCRQCNGTGYITRTMDPYETPEKCGVCSAWEIPKPRVTNECNQIRDILMNGFSGIVLQVYWETSKEMCIHQTSPVKRSWWFKDPPDVRHVIEHMSRELAE